MRFELGMSQVCRSHEVKIVVEYELQGSVGGQMGQEWHGTSRQLNIHFSVEI
jgi:hypothetical protein